MMLRELLGVGFVLLFYISRKELNRWLVTSSKFVYQSQTRDSSASI